MKTDIMALIVFFMMGFNLCIPVIQKQFEIDAINVKADPVGDPPIDNESWWIYPELQPRQIYTPPIFDWGKFWPTFKNHALWSLEGSLDGETWYEDIPGTGINLTRDILNLRTESTGDNSRKVTLNFTAIDPPGPSTSAYYRFSFAIDYRVKRFVNRSGDHEYTLSFEAENETFSLAFNWSDYINSPLSNRSHVRHGVTEIGGHDYFYFRVISDNPVGQGTYVELDPTYTAYTGSEVYIDCFSGRKLVRQSNGTLWCTFTETNDLHIAWSEDEGENWNDYEVWEAQVCYNPTIAVDSNDVVHLVFNALKTDPDDYQLEYTNSSDWTTIIQIRDEDKDHKYPSIAIDSNDNLHVVYHKSEEGTSNDEQVAYISSMNNGGSWGTEKLLTDETGSGDDSWYPTLAIDSNDVIHVVFQCEDHPAYDDILHIQSSDYGDTWSNWESDPVYDDGSKNQRRPSIAIDDNDKLHVVWEGYSQNTNDQIGYSHNASSSWSAVEWVTWDATVDYVRASISVNDNDYVHTVYDVGTVSINHSVNDTSSWTADVPLTGNYNVPNSIFAQHPIIEGAKTNRPKTGYAFVTTYSNTNVTYYASDDLTWDTPVVENNLPTINGEIPANQSTDISITPTLNVTVDDADDDTLTAYWYSNSSGASVENWWNSDFSKRRMITIDNTKVGATLTNFPILFDNTSSDFLNAQDDGDDFVFVSQDNVTQYNHEIESYNVSGNNRLLAWVNITTLSADTDTVLWLYYGNAACSSQENITGTWNSNYVLVHHFEETTGLYEDSTGYYNNATSQDITSQTTTGVVGYCADFEQDNTDFVLHPSDDSLNFTDLTMEFWVDIESVSSDDTFCAKGTSNNLNPYMRIGSDLGFRITDKISKAVNPAFTEFHYITMAFDVVEDDIDIFIDGNEVAKPTNGTGITSSSTDTAFYLGMNEVYANEYLDAQMDEFRASNIGRSDDWILTTYNTINSPSTFLSVDSEENQTIGGWSLFATNSSIDTSGGAVNISQDNSNFSELDITYYWSINLTDGTDWTNETYHFTTGAEARTWQTLDTWNITLSNTTQSYILDTWNLTLSNTTQSYTLDTWNITLSNTTAEGIILDHWNITLSNLTISPYTLDTWNITLGNLTISSFTIDTWNITLSNTSMGIILDTWNLTLSNLTISSFTIDTWNLTLSNTSQSYVLDTWNLTLSNQTISPYILDTWNITLSNTTVGEILDTWNITLGNMTIIPFTLDTWNITLSNTPLPYILDTWNITLSNTTVGEILDRWNLTLSNTSLFLITDVKATPSEVVINDVTINITCNVTSTYAIVNVTLNMTEGDFDMNNIGDLYYYVITNSTVGIHYYHIYANDSSGDQIESATYSFRIIGLSCSFTYTVNGGIMTLTPTITGGTHYRWTFINETGVKGITPWIPIGDIGSYIQGYVYPTTIRVLLSAKNINFNQYANYSGNVKITKSSFEKPEPTEIIEEEPDLKLKNIYDTGISDWLEERKPGEFLVIGSLILLVAIILFKKRPKKIVIYTVKKENIGRKVDKILEEKT